MSTLAFLDRRDLDDDQRRVVAAWRADLEVIAAEARENAIVLACTELASFFPDALASTVDPDGALWLRIYALCNRITKRAAQWTGRSKEASVALRRLRTFVLENADLAAGEGSPLAS